MAESEATIPVFGVRVEESVPSRPDKADTHRPEAEAPAGAPIAADAPPPPPAGAGAPARRRRADRTADERANEEGSAKEGAEAAAAAHAQAEPAQPAAGTGTAAGGQAAGAAISGVLPGVAMTPVVIAGAVLGAVGLVATASGGGSPAARPNRTPQATADTASANEGAAAVTGSVAVNDSDLDGDALTYALAAPVAGLTVNADGSWRFDPAHTAYQDIGVGESRVVTATCSVSDGKGGTATSTLTITVTGTNDVPIAAADAFAVVEDAAVVTGSVAGNDSDVDGDALTYALVAPVAGLTFAADGSYSFDPSHAAYQGLGAGETRDVVVEYTVSDGHGGVAESTLTIRITGVVDTPQNRAPVAQWDGALTVEDAPLLAGSVAANDSDPDGDPLAYRLLTNVPGLTLSADGAWTFDPSHPDYQALRSGDVLEMSATYEVSDGRGGVATAELLIYVEGANDAPVAAAVSIRATEDSGVVRGSLGASDPDGQALTYVLPDPAPAGLTFDGAGGYSFDPSHPAWQHLKAGEVATLVTAYRVVDSSGTASTAALTITVTGTNDAPVASVDLASAVEDGATVAGSVAANDSDADGDALSYELVGPVAGLTLGADGRYVFDPSHPAYQDLEEGETREVVATYVVSDGQGGSTRATLTVTVTGRADRPNAAPVAADDVVAAGEDAVVVTGSVAANDTDPDGDVLRYAVITGAPGLTLSADGSYSFDPSHPAYQSLAEGETRVVTASYVVSDGAGGAVNSTLTITVTGANDAPVAAVDAVEALEDEFVVTGRVDRNDSDADAGAVLTYAPDAPVPGFAMSASGGYSLDLNHPDYQRLAEGQVLVLEIPYTVTDEHGATARSTLTITITGMNDAPSAAPEAAAATEDGAVVTGDVSHNDGDGDAGAVLTYALAAPVPGLVLNSDGTWSFDPSHAAYQDLPRGEQREVTATYTVTDEHGASANATLTITVTGVNDAPVSSIQLRELSEDGGVITGSVARAEDDPDAGGSLAYALTGSLEGLTFNPDGSYSFDPGSALWQSIPAGVTHEVDVYYTITDEHGAQTRSTLTLAITGANDAPVAVADAASAVEDGPRVTGTVAANDGDPDSVATLTYALAAPTPGLTLNPDGSYSFDPSHPAYQGVAQGQQLDVVATYTVTDDRGARTTSTLTITVTGTNDAPVARADLHRLGEDDGVVTGSVAINDVDPDAGAVLTYALEAPVPGLTLSPDGSYSFDSRHPDYQSIPAGESRFIGVTYSVTDEHGAVSRATLTLAVTGANDAPVAAPDLAAALEDAAPVTGSVAANDRDPDTGAALTYALAQPVAGLTLNANGTWSFDPSHADYQDLSEGQQRDVVATYTVTDEHGGQTTATLTITVTGRDERPNIAPVVVDEAAAAAEDGAMLTGSVADNDSDPDGDPLHYILLAEVPGLTMTSTGAYQFDTSHPQYQSLKDGEVLGVTVPYRAIDGFGGSATGTLLITVTGDNDAPVARADVLSGAEGAGVVSGSVAVNDSDVDHDAVLTYAAVGPMPAGFVLNSDGRYTLDASHPAYDHLADQAQLVLEIPYTVTDEHGAVSTSILTLTLTGTNDSPVAKEDAVAGIEDAGLLAGSVATNDSDADDGAVLTYTLVEPRPDGLALGGDGAFSFNAGHASYQYLAQGQVLTIIVPYRVRDQHGAETTASLTITLTGTNDAPVAVLDTASATEDGTPISGSVATNDQDPDLSASLTYAVVGAAPEGLTLAADGTWSFDPSHPAYQRLSLGQTQDVTLTYRVTDEHGASTTSTLTIRVTGVNDAPVAADDAVAAAEDDGIVRGALAANDTDVDDAATLTWSLAGPAPAGFSLGADGQYTFNPADPAYQSLKAGQQIDVVVPYLLTDEHGAQTQGLLTIRLTGRNDGPTAAVDSAAATEDGAVLGGSVAANDDDLDADAVLTYAVVGGLPAGLTFGVDGAWSFDPSNAAYQRLARGQTQDVTVTYTVTDEHGAQATSTLTIRVTGVNDTPAAGDDATAVAEDAAALSGVLSANDLDVDDGAALAWSLVGAAPAGLTLNADGRYGFDPADPAYQSLNAGQRLDIVVPYTVTDEHGAVSQGVLTIAITGTNDGPTAALDTAAATEDGGVISGSVALNDGDIDAGAVLTYVVAGALPAGLTFGADGAWSFNPGAAAYQHLAQGQTEDVTVTYTVTDEHGAQAASTLTIRVTGVNDTPVAASDAMTVSEDAGTLMGSVAANDVDVDDGAVLTYVATGPLPAGFAFGPDGGYSLDLGRPEYQILAQGEALALTVPYTVTDEHGAQSAATLTITVVGANDAPVARADTAVGAENGPTVNGTVALNDSDTDRGAALTYRVDGAPPAGFTMDADGVYRFAPSATAYDYLGAGDFIDIVVPYIVRDQHGAESASQLTIRMTGINDAPVAQSEFAVAVEDGAPVAGSVRANESDPDQNTTLRYEWNSIPPGLTVDNAGNYSFDPTNPAYQSLKAGDSRTLFARYTVRDEHGGSASAQLRITVTGVNDAPQGVADQYIVGEGSVLTAPAVAGVLANDRDPDASLLTAELTTGPANGALVLNPDGSFTYTPNAGFSGSDSFTYTPFDGTSRGDPVTVNLTVAPVTQDGVTFATAGTEFGHVGGERLVNTNKTSGQRDSFTTMLDGGGYLVTWTDANGDGGSDGIKAQCFDASGAKAGAEFLVNTYMTGPQTRSSAAQLPGGGFMVIWEDQQRGEVKARLYDGGGAPLGDEFVVNTQQTGRQSKPAVAALSNGNLVVTWSDESGSTENGVGARAQLFDSTGARIGGEFTVNTNQRGDQNYANVTAAADGGFVITWRDSDNTTAKLQRFDATGTKLGGEVVIDDDRPGSLTSTDIKMLADGRFVAAWRQVDPAGNNICWRVFDNAGQPLTPVSRVHDVVSPGQEDASITALADGGFVIVWTETNPLHGDGSGAAVMAQRFDAAGAPIGAPFVCNLLAAGDQNLPHVAALPNGGFVLTWTDESAIGEDTSGSGVKMQIFGDRPPFDAVEQEALDLKGKITVDEDGGAGSITVVLTVGHGVLEVSPGSSGAGVSGSGTNTVTLTGSRDQINALLGSDAGSIIRYSSASDSPPPGTLLGIEVQAGGVTVAQGNRIIGIREVNDKPVAPADPILEVAEDEPLLTGTLAANDSDPDGDRLTYAQTNTVTGFALNADGSYRFDATNTTYRSLAPGQTRTLTVAYNVSDGRGQVTASTFTIVVTGTNDAPIAHAVTGATDEGRVITGSLNSTEYDTGDAVTYSLVDPAPAGLTLTGGNRYSFDASHPAYAYLAAGERLVLTVRYVATDSHGAMSAESTLTITITGTAAGATASFADNEPASRVPEAEAAAADGIKDPSSETDLAWSDLGWGEADLVPMPRWSPTVTEHEQAGAGLPLFSDVLHEQGDDVLDLLLESIAPVGGDAAVALEQTAGRDQPAEVLVVLDPLDPLLVACATPLV